MKFEIENHTTIDKRFGFGNKYINMFVDYDDVDHIETDAAIETIKDILEKNWNEKLFKEKRKEKAMSLWNENKYNLQSDFSSLEEYMEPYK